MSTLLSAPGVPPDLGDDAPINPASAGKASYSFPSSSLQVSFPDIYYVSSCVLGLAFLISGSGSWLPFLPPLILFPILFVQAL